MHRRGPLPWVIYGVLWLVAVLLIAVPLLLVLWGGFDRFFLREVLAHPAYRDALLRSLLVATIVTSGCLAITVPLAWWSWRVRFRGQGLAEGLLLAPLVLPPFVGALGVFQLFGSYGVLNTLGAQLGWWMAGQGPDWLGDYRFALVCILEILGLYPVLYLTLSAGFSRLDPALLEAAAACGAPPWRRFTGTVLPLLRPALFAGGAVVFVWSFTELGTPLMLAYDRVAPVAIYNGILSLSASNTLPLSLVVIVLAIVAACFIVGRLAAGRWSEALVVKGAAGHAQVQRLSGTRAALAWLPYLAVASLAALPHLMVVLLAVARDWYGTLLPAGVSTIRFHEALAHPMVLDGITNSVIYASLATCLAVALGLGITWCTTRWKLPGAKALDALAMVPLAVPGLIIAFGYLAFGLTVGWKFPALKSWLDPTVQPVPLLIAAYAVRRLPQVLRALHAGLLQAPPVLEEAAAACGAGPLRRLLRITVPLIAASLAGAAILTFSASMLEVSDSLILAQTRAHWPITRVIYDLVGLLGTGPALACAFATWACLFLTVALGCAAVFLGRNPFRE